MNRRLHGSSTMWQFTGKEHPHFAIRPAPHQESVWDYPRPPICVPDQRLIVVEFDGRIVAKTTSAIRVLETASPPTFYIPLAETDQSLLRKTPGSSFCEWKGEAAYWSIEINGYVLKNVGWSYPTPTQTFASIKNYLSFYPAKVKCIVDVEVVRPQPGGFYGGWLTSEIVGPVKGEPGTSGW